MPRLLYLTEQHAHDLVASLMEQVFPDSLAFQLRGDEGRNGLLSALAQARSPYYRTLPEKAGALHHSLNKNHPFTDGNKRFALTAMESFLLLNGAVLLASPDEAKALALGVACGAISRDESIEFVRRRTFRVGWSERTYRQWFQRLPATERALVAKEIRGPTGRFFNVVLGEAVAELAPE